MKKIFIRSKEQVTCIEKSDISEQALYDKFTSNHGQTIYVTDFGKVQGMITVGNFIRNSQNGDELITSKFTKVSMEHEEDAVRILMENTWMESIPVINANNQVEKEYYRCYYSFGEERKEDIIKTIKQIVFEMKYFGITDKVNKMILYSDMLSDNQIEKLQSQENQNVVVLNKISIEEIKDYSSKGYKYACDFTPESFRIRNVFYDKFGIDGIKWDISWNETGICMSDRVNYFKKGGIAVFAESENSLFNWIGDADIQRLQFSQFKWNEQKGCLEYDGDLDNIECIFTMTCCLDTPYIVSRKGGQFCYVPILSRVYWERQTGILASEIDLVQNVLPVLQKNNVRFMLLRDPDIESENEISNQLKNRFANAKQIQEHEKYFLRDWEEDAQCRIREIKTKIMEMNEGFLQRADVQGKYVNVINGERYTVGNAKTGPYALHFFGPCILIGSAVDDEHTIPSLLRPMIPKRFCIKNHTPDYENINFAIRAESFHNGDIIIFVISHINLFEKIGIKTYSFLPAYRKAPDLLNNVGDALKHCNQVVLKYLAEEINQIFLREHFLEEVKNETEIKEKIYFGTGKRNVPKELKEWITQATRKYKVLNADKAGAAVMNCNPFTRGHRYLIETASKLVDVLYVFVLEEDKSYFDFQSRFEMVKEGTKDLSNVVVLPGGKYVISTQTMPGYFNKEDQPFIESVAVMDLSFFAEVIAKEFEIQVRFAGEEPKDNFTRKYNETMSRMLPEYGIEFCEIPRKQIGENVISASLVRKYMEEHNYEAIRELVLPSIYNYLKQKFFKEY